MSSDKIPMLTFDSKEPMPLDPSAQPRPERERFAKMEEKMHKKRVERLKRREKRNKMLKS